MSERATVRRTRGRLGVALAALLALSACAPADDGASPNPATSGATGGSAPASASASASASSSPAAPTPGEGEFANPVVPYDFPDPFILEVDDTYYAYATGIQITTSPDLVDWEAPEIIRVQSEWALRDWWAPEVQATSAGYVMYYTARSGLDTPGTNTAQCIGRAVAPEPDGPFVDELAEPLVCQPDLGGSIDASPFVDADGTLYLLWKNDGNCCAQPVDLWIAPLSADGLTLAGEPTSLGVTNDEFWEGGLIEAPTLWLHEGTYYLFYSANAYYNADYAVGYATSATVTGPYADAEENPILHGSLEDLLADPELQAAGPGHQSIIVDDDGELWMAYHAWDRDSIGPEARVGRRMWIDELVFEDGRPVILGPDTEPQPVP